MSDADILKGKWKQLRGNVQSRWGKLTNDELDQIQGDITKLEGLLQERYGVAREESRKELKQMMDRLEPVEDKSVLY